MQLTGINKELWDRALGRPEFLHQSEGLSALAFVFRDGQRVPEEGFSVHSHPEISIVLSGEVKIGLPDGEHKIPEGTLVVIPGGERHYTVNSGDQPARVLAFSAIE